MELVSILKDQFSAQATILSGSGHGHPGHTWDSVPPQCCPMALACHPPSLFSSPASTAAAAPGGQLRDISVTAREISYCNPDPSPSSPHLVWPSLQGEAPCVSPVMWSQGRAPNLCPHPYISPLACTGPQTLPPCSLSSRLRHWSALNRTMDPKGQAPEGLTQE